MGSIVGLDYAAIGFALSYEPKKIRKKLFNKIRWIERGVLNAIRAKQK